MCMHFLQFALIYYISKIVNMTGLADVEVDTKGNEKSRKMSKGQEVYNLPVGPKDLCFDRNEFIKVDFSVDKFLQDHHKKANLESMRDDLGTYLKVLRSAMIELINRDYADFVNLSTNLSGLDKAITKIQGPLCHLHQEVLAVKSSLDDALSDLTTNLDLRHNLRCHRHSLQCLSTLLASLQSLNSTLNLPEKADVKKNVPKSTSSPNLMNPELVERIAAQYSYLQFDLSQCTDLVSARHKNQVEAIRVLLMNNLGDLFVESIRSSNKEVISRCLRIYQNLGYASAAEELLKTKVIGPSLHDIISEASLEADASGLSGVYVRVLSATDACLKDLLELTAHGKRAAFGVGFHFVVHSFWPEVTSRLQNHLASIFKPGDPDIFFENYTLTLQFITHIERLCGTQAEVRRLHEHAQYKVFMEHWSLPVYFQIRFQEIGGRLESTLSSWTRSVPDLSESGLTKGLKFHLEPTNCVWQSILHCWDPKVFVRQLSHRFWKLSLLIIARYYTWILEAVNEKWSEDRRSGYPEGYPTAARSSNTSRVSRLQFLVWLYADTLAFIAKARQLLDVARPNLHFSEQSLSLCKESLDESVDQLKSRLSTISERIVAEVSSSANPHLRQVNDIPRLFRRTNREVPTKPCSYVTNFTAPLEAFYTEQQSTVSKECLHEWLTLICSAISCQYYVCVSDVLTSVQKTEESLRRLKKMRERGMPSTANEGKGLGDDEKIRRQIAIDVRYFCAEVEKLGIPKTNVQRLDDLLSLVEAAVQGQFAQNKSLTPSVSTAEADVSTDPSI